MNHITNDLKVLEKWNKIKSKLSQEELNKGEITINENHSLYEYLNQIKEQKYYLKNISFISKGEHILLNQDCFLWKKIYNNNWIIYKYNINLLDFLNVK